MSGELSTPMIRASGPALGEAEGQLAGPAAEVDDEPGRRGVHPSQQVGEGSAAVTGEDGILPRVPRGIGRAVAGARCWCWCRGARPQRRTGCVEGVMSSSVSFDVKSLDGDYIGA